MAVYRRVYKSGNSLVIGVPSYILAERSIKVGDYVRIENTRGSSFVVHKVRAGEKEGDSFANIGR